MATAIDRNINESEIIVRFAFEGNYRRKQPFIEENIIAKEIFFDNRYENFPVSVLRKLYASSQECINRGKSIKPLKSLIVFQKKDFDQAVLKNAQVRNDFQATLVGTPLDENDNYIHVSVEVTTETKGNPAHADILITNPGIVAADNENANIAVRSFSSVLFKYCKVITIYDESEVNDSLINDLF